MTSSSVNTLAGLFKSNPSGLLGPIGHGPAASPGSSTKGTPIATSSVTRDVPARETVTVSYDEEAMVTSALAASDSPHESYDRSIGSSYPRPEVLGGLSSPRLDIRPTSRTTVANG
ncbi:hypothetical protein ACOSQ3_010571 [Xanthoceras sorbifolium]